MATRLDSWKDIAKYLQRDVRTAQRWERHHRLPVHRLPGGSKPRVYALTSELDSWLRDRPPETAGGPSVAVLPFLNLTDSKENEYFSDGLAEEIITALARVPGLQVTARTSSFAFRGHDLDVREIGTRLGAAALLEGSVRRSGGQVRISAQLVSAENGYHLWSESYDRELADIFVIQDDIARAIVSALRIRLSPAPLVGAYTSDIEAYDLWLRGRYAGSRYTPEGVATARTCYMQAMSRDPQFPLPYVSVAELLFEGAHFGLVTTTEAVTHAKQAVLQALALDENLGEAYSLLGALKGVFEFDWSGAAQSFRRAMELSPGSTQVLTRHAWYCLVPGLRFSDAIAEMRQAAAQDPLSPLVHMWFGLVYIAARQWEKAEQECRLALDLAPHLHPARWFLGTALGMAGKLEDAFVQFSETYEKWDIGPTGMGAMTLACGMFGRDEEARSHFDRLTEYGRSVPVPPLQMAWGYLGLGDERVFEWLDKSIDARDPAVTHLPFMPMYDGIRNDPRFRNLLKRMRLDTIPEDAQESEEPGGF